MTRVIYSSIAKPSVWTLLSPYSIIRNLLRNRELILAYAKRDFQAAHRGTYLGLAWAIIAPLIMLALFTFVFGYIFNGRFSQSPEETPADFALALFVGLAFFNCIAQSMGAASGLVLGNRAYVKTLMFPLEVLTVSATLNILLNLAIGLALCFAAFLIMHGFLYWSAITLLFHVFCIALLSLGLSWYLSALSVFVRDVPAIISPLTLILMFTSCVFFPLSAIPPSVRWFAHANPLGLIIDQARNALLYGIWPRPLPMAGVLVFCVASAIAGYWFFMRTKPAFGDVI
jgi:lipopolysaccharide transport system permease protein